MDYIVNMDHKSEQEIGEVENFVIYIVELYSM